MENPGTAGFWLSPQQKRIWTLQQEGMRVSFGLPGFDRGSPVDREAGTRSPSARGTPRDLANRLCPTAGNEVPLPGRAGKR